MFRTIEHSAFVRRSLADICHILEHHGDALLDAATAAASDRVTDLVVAAGDPLPHFDRRAPLTVVLGDPERHRTDHAWIEFSWTADRRKRLLANVEARIDIQPLVRTRPVTTELTLRARYRPLPGPRSSPETVLFARRVVKAAMRQFLDAVVDFLESFEESLVARTPEPRRAIDTHDEYQ